MANQQTAYMPPQGPSCRPLHDQLTTAYMASQGPACRPLHGQSTNRLHVVSGTFTSTSAWPINEQLTCRLKDLHVHLCMTNQRTAYCMTNQRTAYMPSQGPSCPPLHGQSTNSLHAVSRTFMSTSA